MRIDMVDASHNDALDINGAIVSGVQAIALKVSQGSTFLDPAFSFRYATGRGANVPIVGYHFLTHENSQLQMHNFKAGIEGRMLVPALDYETDPDTNLLPALSILEEMVQQAVATWGHHPLVYGNRYDLANVTPDMEIAKCPLWLADYNASSGQPVAMPPAWAHWDILQFADNFDGTTADSDKFNLDLHPEGIVAWLNSMMVNV